MDRRNTYRILHENYDEDGWECKAYRAEGAAEQFAEHYDRYDYSLSRDEDASEEIIVVSSDGTRTRFRISAYTTTNYRATEVEPAPAAETKDGWR